MTTGAQTTRRQTGFLPRLLDCDLGASLFQLLLQLLGIGLRDAFLHLGRGTLNHVLGLLEAQAGRGTHHLDDADLVVAECLEDNVELGLLGSGFATASTASFKRESGRSTRVEINTDNTAKRTITMTGSVTTIR